MLRRIPMVMGKRRSEGHEGMVDTKFREVSFLMERMVLGFLAAFFLALFYVYYTKKGRRKWNKTGKKNTGQRRYHHFFLYDSKLPLTICNCKK